MESYNCPNTHDQFRFTYPWLKTAPDAEWPLKVPRKNRQTDARGTNCRENCLRNSNRGSIKVGNLKRCVVQDPEPGTFQRPHSAAGKLILVSNYKLMHSRNSISRSLSISFLRENSDCMKLTLRKAGSVFRGRVGSVWLPMLINDGINRWYD